MKNNSIQDKSSNSEVQNSSEFFERMTILLLDILTKTHCVLSIQLWFSALQIRFFVESKRRRCVFEFNWNWGKWRNHSKLSGCPGEFKLLMELSLRIYSESYTSDISCLSYLIRKEESSVVNEHLFLGILYLVLINMAKYKSTNFTSILIMIHWVYLPLRKAMKRFYSCASPLGFQKKAWFRANLFKKKILISISGFFSQDGIFWKDH